jgi:hypothetical protein
MWRAVMTAPNSDFSRGYPPRPRHMEGSVAPEGFSALPRPPTRFNRFVRKATGAHKARALTISDLRPYIDDSLAIFAGLAADCTAIEAVRDNFERHWLVAEAPAPRDVWCGEVTFRDGQEPVTLMYPDSPWGRLPGPVFPIATQAGVDHMVAHLVEYFSGTDYGEAAACRDQVRLMLARRRPAATAMAVAIALGHRLHKRIPLTTYRTALAERFG